MNYNQKRTLIGRIIYIGLTMMAVTVLCVTMYTFFGSSKRNEPNKVPAITDRNEKPPVTQAPPATDNQPPVTIPPDTSDSAPTINPDKKDWLSQILTNPVEGSVMKKHDPVNAVYSETMNDYRVHEGIDIECSLGDEVVACAYGTVVSVGIDPFMGNCVTIDHGDGLVSVYKNLSLELPEEIKVGAEIFEGDVIGNVGESAIIEVAEEPHLHFELKLNGEQIDPTSILDYTPVNAEEDDNK